MASEVRAALLRALREAARFDLPADVLDECLRAEPTLLSAPDRVAAAEAVIRGTLADGSPIPADVRGGVLPVLGNIAEAVIEVILEMQGWQPVGDDPTGFSSAHGIDLLMLDPTFEHLVAIEVKSTIQASRWPRLAAGSREQLTPEWFDAPGNEGMTEWDLGSADIYTMVVQVHLRQLRWRACLAGDIRSPQPLAGLDQLASLDWLTA